jgi:tRNA pseudouridine32 synthase / 23S rRNA pseudouridine746 synthase
MRDGTSSSGPELRPLFVDEQILVVDKLPGWLVIPGRGVPEPTLREAAEAAYGRLWVVHRLDRGTSGLLVFGRTAEAHRALNLAFDRRQVSKRYLALVRGRPPPQQEIAAAIAPARRGRMRPARSGDTRGKPALTRLRLLEAFGEREGLPELALVEATPETGRTHQIRVHLAHAGTPLAVDPDYGTAEPLRGPRGAILLDRTPLHAAYLEFAHPGTGKRMLLEAPMPADMAGVIAVARGTAEGALRAGQ